VVKYFLTNSSLQTRKAGQALAANILKSPQKTKAVVLGLRGDLGGGKTTFLQGLAKGLGIKDKVLSPTFIVMRRMKIGKAKFKNFYHLDCYRIEKDKELLTLGWESIISDPKNIVAIEWVDKIKKILPKDCLILEFEFLDKNKRKIIVK
jgi:tRNA threonylcarbamoyladenosine biosynthesis protein TsaE